MIHLPGPNTNFSDGAVAKVVFSTWSLGTLKGLCTQRSALPSSNIGYY